MMPEVQRQTKPSRNELLTELAQLRREVAQLREENTDLETMLQTMTDHSDTVQEELYEEKEDLEVVLDITTEHSDEVEEELQIKAEDALRESERRLRLIVEATPVPVIISRLADDEILYANHMAGPLVGLPTETLLGRKVIHFFHEPADRQSLLNALTREGEVNNAELQIKKSDDTPLWVEVSLRCLIFNDEPSLLSAFHDITERKRASEALQQAVDNLTQMNVAARRFVPSEFLKFFQKQSIVDLQLGDQVSQEMTIMFSDIRDFTTLSETMTPQENFNFVNAYLKWVSPVIREHRGFIIRYMGDGMMAVFPTGADDAIRAGIEKLKSVAAFNQRRRKQGEPPIRIGLGMDTGEMMVGVIGEASRMQPDAFSDHINLAARLESLTKFYHVSFIISADMYHRLVDPGQYHIRFLDKVQVHGRTEPVDLYEVFDADASDVQALKQETQTDLVEAQRLYYAKQFAAAQAQLFNILHRNPHDKVAWHYLTRATQLLDDEVSENWTGVTVMTEK
ncbi:MAG: PAS domain S-box protein [Candidatus Poribacteria bacterium]|nr:PAS domain S-box protein [Candidatus Poribacteria bacterium]